LFLHDLGPIHGQAFPTEKHDSAQAAVEWHKSRDIQENYSQMEHLLCHKHRTLSCCQSPASAWFERECEGMGGSMWTKARRAKSSFCKRLDYFEVENEANVKQSICFAHAGAVFPLLD
jgi:hypothetical protein